MDRALNAQLLSEALGTHERLPTPQELGDLLAQAEIDLFLGATTDHERLLISGWYLHSIAGARSDSSDAVRRQQVGRVSAHIFDVFLQGGGAELTGDEQLRYAVAAEFGYLIGDLAPNATALASQLPGPIPSVVTHPGRASLYAAAILLGLDRRRLRETIAAWAQDRFALSAQSDGAPADPDSSPHAPALATIAGIEHLYTYLFTGNAAALENASEQFRRALRVPGGPEDTDSRWVAALLSDLGNDLAASSVWAVLPPDKSPTARALVLSDPAVLLFWPPQEAFLRSDPSPLDPATRRQVLAFPTSAGKTLVSQVMILSHIQTSTGDVCVVAPTHSLCREIQDALAPRLRLLRTTVVDAGPLGSGPMVPATGRVVVMTPERFSGLLRFAPDDLLGRFSLFVIDEAHLLAERERGWGLEEALTLVHHLTRETQHRLVLVSAAMGAGAHVISWLTTDQHPLIKSDDWRGPRRLYALYTTEFDQDPSHTIVEPQVGTRLERRRVPVVGKIHLRQSSDKVVHRRFTEPVGVHVFRKTRAGGTATDDGTTSQLDRVVPLIHHLVDGRKTPTLVIVATREDARKLASSVAELLPPAPELVVLADRVRARVGDEHVLPQLIRKGVAYHHGALPTDVQAEIEDSARARQIRCLVATATLTEGVNLPFKAVVIASTGYGRGDKFVEIIDAPRLINALGRAGRACRETEAWLFLVRHESFRPAMFDQLRQEGADLPLRSSLVADEALEDLAAFELLVAAGVDAALHDTGTSTNEFCSFVWHLAELLGAFGAEPDLDAIMSVVESSLAWAQADENLRQRWRNLVQSAKQSYDATPPATRRRYAQSGASLVGAAALDAVRDAAIDAVAASQPASILEWISTLLGGGRLGQLLALPENRIRGFRPYRTAPAANRIDVDLVALLQRWVAGDELEALGTEFLEDIANVDYRAEALSEFTSTVFEHHLPWALGSLIEWINEELQAVGSDIVVPTSITSHIHFGAGTPTAIELMAGGVRSRRLAQAVAAELGPQVDDLRSTVTAMGLQAWRDQFGAYPAELRDLLTYVGRAPKIMTDVLEGSTESVAVSGTGAATSGAATLRLDPEASEPEPLQVLVGAAVVGHVASDCYTEMRQLLDLGFTLDLHYDHMTQALAVGLSSNSD